MSEIIEQMDISLAINYLIQYEDLKLPHQLSPQILPSPDAGYGSKIFTKEQWDAYQWNPVGFLTPEWNDYGVEDPDASPKPTWADLVRANALWPVSQYKEGMYYTIDKQATDRINVLYGVDVKSQKRYREELIKRIVPDYPSAADTIRLEIIAKYHEFKTAIQQATSLATLDDMDITSNTAWGQDDEDE